VQRFRRAGTDEQPDTEPDTDTDTDADTHTGRDLAADGPPG
jgi:hypothetical protein